MGKYLFDNKGQAAITNYHEKNKPGKLDKKQQVKALREKMLKNKKNTDKS
ncbi:hypothetical protein [Vagococcus intermedius]|uniref:30S ribosomal protein S10 n=1 Tax=Vagococcus intermedius TaxID=2991418 RepID=A0AAF0I7M6_9ENTE|nr:hypothetical protein [Vagococcus intermedius]WEG73485.1 hypothetical protein OL234_00835 [Vagococcus intermedius]WEG75569.1 hypothetical protein OL235_00845 [Vagococcus intermedius]